MWRVVIRYSGANADQEHIVRSDQGLYVLFEDLDLTLLTSIQVERIAYHE